ncbi:Sec14p-like phosphatidylinositol transfer family protein [Abeliophyllum distichum]|uniref:Sec14p-like phosphatidylinositol transfer family protein n=1 Tax=Abeliophyllum distichum TaxID=126358 RepID=A0ABD1SUH5_9LAMI
MSSESNKTAPNGCDNSLAPEVQQRKINEVRRLIGPQSGKLALYCSDASISRYLRAQNWNVNKAVKMLKATLKWRMEYKPEEIRWGDVAKEAETGKIYRASYKDKHRRPVLVMRPRCQNSKSIKGQIKYLVYCMENAILNLPQDQEQMVWLIDFHGFSLSNISIKVTRETAHVLQERYPERLGVAILYDPPKIFEPFWTVAKPFLESKTVAKVKFVYSDNPNAKSIMDDLFDMELVESAFGGKDDADFEINKYAERMREDDKKIPSFWTTDNNSAATLLPIAPSLDPTNSELESDASEEKADKSSFPRDDEDDTLVDESLPSKQK